MFTQTRTLNRTLRTSFIIVNLLMALLATVSVVAAAFYPINTNDNSTADWNTVAVFQTDPASDVITGTEDILNTWVAVSAVTTTASSLNFMVETRTAPALNVSGNAQRGVVAIIDCDRDGLDNEAHDRMITYLLGNSYNDQTSVCQGSYPQSGQCYILPGTGAAGPEFGERVGSTAFIEWRVPVTDLPPDDLDTNNCRGLVNIRFATVILIIPSLPWNPVTITNIDQTTPLQVYNVAGGTPTRVALSSFRSASDDAWNRQIITLALAGIATILWIGVIVSIRRRNRSTPKSI
ncbi:MAG: hypothetical protein HY868_08170 [Chloroflexi bacterium]|nr:hypothetical protein [Chloroflexota bacterium]